MRDVCDGLIIRECDVGESDKLLTVLTRERGKLLLLAKGVRSKSSKLSFLCRIFNYANFEYYEKNGRFWLASGDITTPFFTSPKDIDSISIASYVLEVACEISGENFSDETLLRLLLNTLYALENKLRPYEQIKGAFEFFAATHAGFAPDVSECESCGSDISDENNKKSFMLDVRGGALICSECATNIPQSLINDGGELIPLTPEVIMAIRYAVSAPVNRLFSFTLSKESDVLLFSRAGENYLRDHLERGFEALDFYRAMNKI